MPQVGNKGDCYRASSNIHNPNNHGSTEIRQNVQISSGSKTKGCNVMGIDGKKE